MNLDQLTELFKWMSIINICILTLSTVLIILLKNIMYKMHGKLFGIEKENLALVSYQYLGMYKIIILVFNITPYISLLLIK